MRYAFAADLDWIALLRGDRKSAARLERFLGGFPPPFPLCFGEHVTDQPFSDLLRAGFAVQTFQNISHERDRIFPGQIFDRRQVGRLACKKMLRRKRREILRRVPDLHGMRLLARKVDHDLIE